MTHDHPRVTLEPISPALAQRIVDRTEIPGDDWHPEYPFVDELDPLRSLARSTAPHPVFTMYLVRRSSDGLAVGGLGFFGPPDSNGRVELGYGLVPGARGAGLAKQAVGLALRMARDAGATVAAADTEADNLASRRVLAANGFLEVERRGGLVLVERPLGEL
ncbi:GNAT family N-acetyltransferase [Sanguibacter sp. 4.1]|uniref:GNAT family N-acetyltransferase n=1 Tax=Sanguibacter biliveldensis TaxID=3030830 RepID=A0AAF1BWI4_9MICO|nr:GNAT family N-acetyltransferase [Sanguibacter sp. 4.1]WPF80671.1 GNAT family N-acetyltransferase [Sanguibacter sp. 4.1]